MSTQLSSYQALDEFYTYKDRGTVYAFLEQSPFLVPILLEAYSQIEKYFGSHPEVRLEVMTDHEYSQDQALFANIITSLNRQEALNKLNELDEGWWLEASGKGQDKMCIYLEIK